jgi:hypothetical protein
VESSIPALMIEKCAQLIDNAIIPALEDESLVVQARFAAVILHTFAPLLEEKSKDLPEENRVMKEILVNSRDVVGRHSGASNQAWLRLAEAVDREVDQSEITDVLEENRRLKAVLTDTIKALEALKDQTPEDDSMAALWRLIHKAIRQQINHDCACLAGAGQQVKV